MKKVLLLTQHFRPEPNFMTGELVDQLLISGAVVTVITAHPNYPLGRFYDSVETLLPMRERRTNGDIWRLPIYPSHNQSKIARFIHYISFALAATIFAPFVSAIPDTVVVYQTPFTTALAALFFKYAYRSKLVFISADLWPESFSASGIRLPFLLEKLMYAYSKWINRRADINICTTRGMLQRYHSDGIPLSKLTYIPLWVDASGGELNCINKSNLSNVLECIYIGSLGSAQGVETIVQAAAVLQKDKISVRLDIYGSGVEEEKLRKLAEDLQVKNLIFHGRVSSQDAFSLASKADVQLIHLVPSPLFAMTVPSKLAFSLSAGTPIIAGVIGESARLIEESGGGIVVAPSDAQALAKAISIYTEMAPEARINEGAKARAFYEDQFEKGKLKQKYARIILQ